MYKEDIEALIGEDLEDMGLIDHVDEDECEDCGRIIEDYWKGQSTLCSRCRKNYGGE